MNNDHHLPVKIYRARMDSRSRLDYALFQLTPTRTRCDLVICAGESKEKLASGLLEPFIAHLKFAKDEISKGGYSITLSASDSDSAYWFTKSTLERFVKFVSTPEVLERFIAIEKEIANIENSIYTNAYQDSQTAYALASEEYSNQSTNPAYKHEFNATSDAANEEDSKIHLHRVLGSRKAALEKEQAMVYARALVAGFENDYLEDLICFADAFGSPRLREACLNFMELCNTKSNNEVWMDEVAAMQAYSQSQYEDYPHPDLNINVQKGNFTTKKQNVAIDAPTSISSSSHDSHLPQYVHTYQTGPMSLLPHYEHQNLPWPPRSRVPQQDGNFNSSDSSSESDSSHYKKGSSRKVIIKNINFITSGKDQETESPEGQKVTPRWDTFQNLLMKDADDKEKNNHVKNSSPVINKYSTYEEKLFTPKFEDPKSNPSRTIRESPNQCSTIGGHEEDWFIRSGSNEAVHDKSVDIFEDDFQFVESKDVLNNNPLAVQSRSLNPQLKKEEIFIVSKTKACLQEKVEATCVNEPSDLYMVLERYTADQEGAATWTPEMELGSNNNNDNKKMVKLGSVDDKKFPSRDKETNITSKRLVGKGRERKGSNMEVKSKSLLGSQRKNKSDIVSIGKTTIQKGKSEMEEEKRKKMEELVTQRQKRITERSASSAKTIMINKPKAQVVSRDVKKSNKPVIKSSTIDRLSAARITPKVLPSESKPGNKPRKVIEKSKIKPDTIKLNSNGVKKKMAQLKNVKPLRIKKALPVLNDKALNSASISMNEDIGAKENPIVKVNHEISEIEISTPPPEKVSPATSNHRKKWSNGETSIKALNGLKKLLSFAKRS